MFAWSIRGFTRVPNYALHPSAISSPKGPITSTFFLSAWCPLFSLRIFLPLKTHNFPPPPAQSNARAPYDGVALMADPIHGPIIFTVPFSSPEVLEQTEKDLIDSPWMQRLRSIYQLQSTRWVYPSAEHSRFQHSLGAMHLAGRFAKALYPTLQQTIPNLPSEAYIEELLRITALLHDIGHGPFCHFFDQHVLEPYGLSHEHLGQTIIREHLAPMISHIRRSPSNSFASGERLDPNHIAFLILKDPHKPGQGLSTLAKIFTTRYWRGVYRR